LVSAYAAGIGSSDIRAKAAYSFVIKEMTNGAAVRLAAMCRPLATLLAQKRRPESRLLLNLQKRHAGVNRHPGMLMRFWIQAFAGMTLY
jgi:hypothetical protein